jgi:hypothetical protein
MNAARASGSACGVRSVAVLFDVRAHLDLSGSSSLAKKHRGGLQDLVRPAQIVHLATKLADLFALLRAQQVGALAAVGLRLTHTLSQRLSVDAQISSDMRDRPSGLEHEPDAALHQLIGVFLRSWHEPEFLSRGDRNPRFKVSVKPGLAQSSVFFPMRDRALHVSRVLGGD